MRAPASGSYLVRVRVRVKLRVRATVRARGRVRARARARVRARVRVGSYSTGNLSESIRTGRTVMGRSSSTVYLGEG